MLGLQIHYGVHDTTFGKALIATTPRGIFHLHLLNPADEQTPAQIIRQS